MKSICVHFLSPLTTQIRTSVHEIATLAPRGSMAEIYIPLALSATIEAKSQNVTLLEH